MTHSKQIRWRGILLTHYYNTTPADPSTGLAEGIETVSLFKGNENIIELTDELGVTETIISQAEEVSQWG